MNEWTQSKPYTEQNNVSDRVQEGGASANSASAAKPMNVSVTTSGAGKKKSSSAFRTISEVADELGVQQHVLRFWETKFSHVRPLKRGGGRRYYRPEDVVLLKKIHTLLYTDGYTIKGVQKLLRENGKNQLLQKESAPMTQQAASEQTIQKTEKTVQQSQGLTDRQRSILKSMLGELKEMRDLMRPETALKTDRSE